MTLRPMLVSSGPLRPERRRVRHALGGIALIVLLLGGCIDGNNETVADPRPSPTRVDPSPRPEPTPPKLRRALARLERVRERAAADGRIDRREAILLARGVSTKPYKYIEANRVWRTGDGEHVAPGDRPRRVWDVLLMERDGCHQRSTIDVRTGESGKYAIMGCP